MATLKQECEECGSTWELKHDNFEEPIYCPFCGDELVPDDDEDLDFWDEEEFD